MRSGDFFTWREQFLLSRGSHDSKAKVVFSFCLGGLSMYSLARMTVPSHLAYSEICGADYYLFTEPCPGLPSPHHILHQSKSGVTYNKLACLDCLRDYRQILYLDLDVLVSRHAPPVFEIYSTESFPFAAWNESHLDPSGVKEAIQEVALWSRKQAWPASAYFNSGVFVIRGEVLGRLALVPESLFLGRWSEQTYLNMLINTGEIGWIELDRRFNCIVGLAPDEDVKKSFFWHFAGMTSPSGTLGPNRYFARTVFVREFCVAHAEMQFTQVLDSLPGDRQKSARVAGDTVCGATRRLKEETCRLLATPPEYSLTENDFYWVLQALRCDISRLKAVAGFAARTHSARQ